MSVAEDRWEYQIVDGTSAVLNELGKDGWEAVSMAYDPHDPAGRPLPKILLKRRLQT